ncbi:response regulator [Thermodesulfobacteriota bacterium]
MSINRTILIAEPDDTLSMELHGFTVDNNIEIVEASTLKETLLTIQEQRIDVLLLDAALLEEDCDFISIIKGMEEKLPIIICAEANTPEFEGKVRQKGIFFYHLKSFGIQDLEMAIGNAIAKSS